MISTFPGGQYTRRRHHGGLSDLQKFQPARREFLTPLLIVYRPADCPTGCRGVTNDVAMPRGGRGSAKNPPVRPLFDVLHLLACFENEQLVHDHESPMRVPWRCSRMT